MSSGWCQKHTELADFIAGHSEIKIEASRVCLPNSVRPEFYRLFDVVRTAFVEGKFPGLLNEAKPLSENYLKAEEEVIKLLGLDSVSQPTPLHWFLHSPVDGLIRELFDPLFDLLKGKADIQTFEEMASRIIEASFRVLYRRGYEKWVILSLARLLEADKSFQVILRELSPEEQVIIGATSSKEGAPAPVESKHLTFDHGLEPIFTVPDFVVHSTKINRYLSVRSDYRAALATASNASDKREWYSLDSVGALEPGLTLVYIADNPDGISLVADAEKICRPDLILECRGQEDWLEEEGLEQVRSHHAALKPKLGTYIVSREPVPERALADLGEDGRLLTVGFDASKLTPIIDALMEQN